MTGAVTVIWTKSWEGAPFLDPAACKHPGTAALAIGLTVDRPARGAAQVATVASLCMLCGTDSSGAMTPEAARVAAWNQHGWDPGTAERLLALTDRETAALTTPTKENP